MFMGNSFFRLGTPLKKFYTFLFVDCIYITIRKEMETKNCAVYVVLGYDADGVKDVLGLWIGESEGKHYWMGRPA